MRFVVVGAGIAGHRAATHLRGLKPDANIDIVGDEVGRPYDRPPLSKETLGDGAARYLTTEQEYSEKNISYHSGQMVAHIDRSRSEIKTLCGTSYVYDRLLLATGSRPRKLPAEITCSQKIIYLRTLDDAVRLRSVLEKSRRIAVIGGGFIGLEIAAAARARECEVLLFELADHLLSRGMPAVLSRWVEKLHRQKGVKFEFGAKVDAINDRDGGSLRLHRNGSFIDVDAVIVGIGIQPNVELALNAGLDVNDGIVVDDRCQTSDPSIFAAGEVTSHPVSGGPRRQRIESWKVASDQAVIAAKSMAGIAARYAEPPWLWSDQFGHNIQSLGAVNDAGNTIVLGDTESDHWTMIFRDADDKITGAIAVNSGRDISLIKRSMLKDRSVPEALLDRAVRSMAG